MNESTLGWACTVGSVAGHGCESLRQPWYLLTPRLTTAGGRCSSRKNSVSSQPLLSQRHGSSSSLIAWTEATPQQGLRTPCLWGMEVEGSSQKLSVCQEIEQGSLPISFSSVPSLVPEI